jgi:ornithine cyclodeaminase
MQTLDFYPRSLLVSLARGVSSENRTLVLGAKDVYELLSMADCIKVMDETFREMARGEAGFVPRQVMPQPDKKGVVAMMPGYLGPEGMLGIKVISVFPGNLGTPFESHQGAVLLFESAHGRLLCVADAGAITRIRTAAASGVATDALANKDVSELGILGSGTQASSHLEAMLVVRPGIRRTKVWSRNPANAKSFAIHEASRLGVEVDFFDSPQDAVLGSGIVCTTTGAASPILRGAWLNPGTHVNAVGASRPGSRELDTEAVAKARLFVDSKESAHLESDDFRIPRQEGVIGDDHIKGEIGEVLIGKVKGRTKASDVTIFKSLGIAIEDLAAAHYLYSRALTLKTGSWLEFSSLRGLGPAGRPQP